MNPVRCSARENVVESERHQRRELKDFRSALSRGARDQIFTIRTGGQRIFVALGTDFTGFGGKGYVDNASEILPRLQSLIHEHAPVSKYDAWGPSAQGEETAGVNIPS